MTTKDDEEVLHAPSNRTLSAQGVPPKADSAGVFPPDTNGIILYDRLHARKELKAVPALIIGDSLNECEDCLKIGDSWVHLRLCLTCGHVGCCDDSKNKHATRHFHATNHPIIQSFEPGEDWAWCYIDELLLEPACLSDA